jgi:hypothetical protein
MIVNKKKEAAKGLDGGIVHINIKEKINLYD